jgi:type II secretory pathway pseudopilin PulG
MYLAGQDSQRGYAMAALLVSIGVMTLLMSVALPVWRHEAQREKEAELIFRGQQYARAVNLYTRKAGPGNFPPSIDILVQQRFLRKKYKDPMTKDGEFDIITAATAQGSQASQPGIGRGNTARGSMPVTNLNNSARPVVPASPVFIGQNTGASPFSGGQQGAASGGIMGVRSKNKDTSIRQYNGGTHYNEWSFLFSNVSNRPGATGRGAGNPLGADRPGFPRGGGPGGPRGGGPGIGGPGTGGPRGGSFPGIQPGRRGGG